MINIQLQNYIKQYYIQTSTSLNSINTVWKAVVLYNYVLKQVPLFKHDSIGTLFICWLSRLKATMGDIVSRDTAP